MQTFLEAMKAKCEKKAAEMARLELSVWNDTHEKELKKNFGFTVNTLKKRKQSLQQIITTNGI